MKAERIILGSPNLNRFETSFADSMRDSLTGLYNGAYLEEMLQRELDRAIQCQLALSVIMIGINDFQRYNITFGRHAGDRILRAVSHFLKENIRAEDIACRYGGDEFISILKETSLVDACRRAEGLRLRFKYMKGGSLSPLFGTVSLSIGVAAFPENGTDTEALLKGVQDALSRAKTQGGDCVVSAEQVGIQSRSDEKFEISCSTSCL